MSRIDHAADAFGEVFRLAHRWQALGDRLDARVTTRQWFVLAAIWRSPRPDPTLGEVAEFVGISRQAVRKSADILAREGLLSLEDDPTDARVVRLRITTEGASHLATRDHAERRLLEAAFARLDDTEIERLAQTLTLLAATADNLASDGPVRPGEAPAETGGILGPIGAEA